jgi:hypothetical protein
MEFIVLRGPSIALPSSYWLVGLYASAVMRGLDFAFHEKELQIAVFQNTSE